jgi:hypothetical protein
MIVMMRSAFWFVLLAGCSSGSSVASGPSAEGEPVAISQQALGVGDQQNGFPSPWERAVFMAANRARSDPSMVKGAMSTIYPAVKPLVLESALEQSSRFHSTNLLLSDVQLMHTSPCTLNTDVATSGCTGSPTCACATPVAAQCANCSTDAGAINNCGTPIFTRIHYFYPPANAEVAAAGFTDPWGVMDDPKYGWTSEPAGADGHRTIIDSVGGDYSVAGFGHAAGTGECWATFDVGDFGPTTTAPTTPPRIASAAPMPFEGAAGSFTIYATWADTVGGAPVDLNAVVDGTCSAMTLELGTPALNATYSAQVTLATGCHSVFIVGDDAEKVRTTYPETTAFTIAVGGGTCADFVAQPAVTCPGVDGGVGGADAGSDTGSTPEGGTVSSEGGRGVVGSEGGSVVTGSGEAGSNTSPEGGGLGGAVDAGANTGGNGPGGSGMSGNSSGCGCRVAQSTGTTSVWAAFAAGCLVLPLRGRRRARRSGRT